MIKTLRRKFVLINMLLVAVIIVAVFTSVAAAQITAIHKGGEQSLHMFINLFSGDQPQRFRIETSQGDGGRDQFFINNLGTAFVIENRSDGLLRVQGFVDIDLDATALYEAAMEAEEDEGILKQFGLRYLRHTTWDGVKIAFGDYAGEQAQVRKTVISCMFFAFLAMALFFVVSLFLSTWALRPVKRAWQQQRRFLSDASHELKTPLTVILANLSIMQKRENQSGENLEKWLKSSEYEAERMKTMVEQMLFLAKSDEDKLEQAILEQVNLSALVEETALSFESVAYEARATLDIAVEPDIELEGSSDALCRLVNILLDNGIKYATGPKQILVSLRQDDGISLLVKNTAEAVEQGRLEQMFDRFYRAEEARSAPGYGLGLPIARTIVEDHGGKISARYEDGFMVFEVRLP